MIKEKTEERDYFFDNYRLLLIFLVVFAHLISPLSNINTMKVLYRYIYLFHMPGMIFISGYFSKKSIKDGKLVKNKIFNYFVLYMIFQLLFSLLVNGKFSIYQSNFGLWYLQIIMLYMLLLPILSRVKPIPMMIVSIILGLAVGLDSSAGHIGSLQRLLTFMPFYLAGYYIDRFSIEKILKKRYIPIAIIILGIIAFLQYRYMNDISWSLNLSSGKLSYGALKISNITGLIGRSVLYIISFLMCFSLMTLTPKRKFFLTKFGGRTIQVFLFHLPLVVILRNYTELYYWLKSLEHIPAMLIITSIGILVTLILSLKPFSYPIDWIMKIRFKHLLKGESE